MTTTIQVVKKCKDCDNTVDLAMHSFQEPHPLDKLQLFTGRCGGCGSRLYHWQEIEK